MGVSNTTLNMIVLLPPHNTTQCFHLILITKYNCNLPPPNILRTQTNGVWMGKGGGTKTVENVEGRISPTAHKFIDQHTHAGVLA